MKKFVAAMVVVVCGISFLSAEEFFGTVKKVDGNKVTVQKLLKKGEKGDEVTLTVSKDVKVNKAKFNKEDKKFEVGESVEGGLKNELFTKEGNRARFVTSDNGEVKEVHVMGGRKKKDS